MNHYAVELTRTVYITINVDARDPTEAEELAWREIENGNCAGNDITSVAYAGDAHWEISDISEEVATDDTRSNGPHGAGS
jgi:hypothetical protein